MGERFSRLVPGESRPPTGKLAGDLRRTSARTRLGLDVCGGCGVHGSNSRARVLFDCWANYPTCEHGKRQHHSLRLLRENHGWMFGLDFRAGVALAGFLSPMIRIDRITKDYGGVQPASSELECNIDHSR